MADRNLNFSPDVTNVTPELPDNSIISGVSAIAENIAEQSATTKALAATAATQVKFRQLDSEFRLQYASDPTNALGLKNLTASRQAFVNENAQNVPAMTQRAYTDKAIELGQASDASNTLWTTHQQVRNTVNNMQSARVTYLNEANNSGRDFATSGNVDLSSALNYLGANQSIQEFANPVLGADKTAAFLKTFNSDYVKSFVAGVAEISPKQAAALLDDPNIKDHFSTQDRGDMVDLIARTQKQNALANNLKTTNGDAGLTDIVNNPDTNYFEKRAAIDTLDMQGSISSKAASAARRVIKSSDNLDTITDTPVMADIINKTYDLNANKNKPSDYLMGVQDLHQQILEKQASGELTAQDANKLSKSVSNLTSAKLADATNSAGHQFRSANDQFKALPPEYRGDATRQLFYASFGQKMTDQQLSNQANVIIDKINQSRRADALSTVSRIGSDDTFLKSLGYTQEQVAVAAKNKGMTPQAVISALRGKYTKTSKRARPVANVAPEDNTDTGSPAGIKLDGLPPEIQTMPELQDNEE